MGKRRRDRKVTLATSNAQQHQLPARQMFHKHISGTHKLLDFKLDEVWRYRDLVVLFTHRNFTVRFKQTILGPLWLFITPLITSLMYAFVFGNIANISTDGVPKILFYLVSTAAWTLFSSSITGCAETFTANASVMSKVYFPRLVMPISTILSSIMQFGLQMIPVLFFYLYYLATGAITTDPMQWLLIPGCLIHMGLIGLGFGIIVSALTTRYRDLAVLVRFGVSLWMYATPVVYPLSAIPDAFRQLMLLNPVTVPMELLRQALWQHSAVGLGDIALSWAVTIPVLIAGIILFNHVERVFADTV